MRSLPPLLRPLPWLLLAACGPSSDTGTPGTDTDTDVETGTGTDTGPDTGLHVDADGDGWPASEDCDDDDPDVHPGAVEVCDGTDHDCDGELDDCGTGMTEADGRLLGEAAGDEAGQHVSWDDLDLDGYDDLLVGATEQSRHAEDHGAAYVVYGPFSGEATLDTADAVLRGMAADDNAGRTVLGVGDTDGDGHRDLLVTANGVDTVAYNGGAAYLVQGPVSGEIQLGDAEGVVYGNEAGTWVGDASTVGDIDQDGLADFMVGGQFAGGESAGGAAWIVFGPVEGEYTFDAADVHYAAQEEGSDAGSALAGVGDVDGSGLPDIVVGARFDDTGALDGGAVYLDLDPEAGSWPLPDLDGVYAALEQEDSLGSGWSLAGGSDLDADGYPDLLLGAPMDHRHGEGGGAVYVVAGGTQVAETDLEDARAVLVGQASAERFGYVARFGGDLDGDGYPEVWAGAPYATIDGEARGAAWSFAGPLSGVVELPEARGAVLGSAEGDLAGRCLAGGLDTDGDGDPELLFSALADDAGGEDAGGAYLFLEPPFRAED